MKILIRTLLAVISIITIWWISQAVASESGEVVVLITRSGGEANKTRLWIVDHDGHQYLRAGSGESAWFGRLLADPKITVVRLGEAQEYRAEAAPDKLIAINDLMREKYAWRDVYISLMFGRDDAVPVKLSAIGPSPP